MSYLQRAAVLGSIVGTEENSSQRLQEESVSKTLVSPISCIARDLKNSKLSPQVSANCTVERASEDHVEPSDAHRWSGHSCDDGLFKNAFKIRSTPETSVRSNPRARRVLSMVPRRLSSPEDAKPSGDKENNASATSPMISSPLKVLHGKKFRNPLEDYDPNSQDSGYEAGYARKAGKPKERARFLEPQRIIPRRMSFESQSPTCGSAAQESSPIMRIRSADSFYCRRSSSGYESTDDGFIVHTANENMDDSPRMPNGICKLLSGNISDVAAKAFPANSTTEAGAPTTPQFSRAKRRASTVRRVLSLQNERIDVEDKHPMPALTKVRACLFHSPSECSMSPSARCQDHSTSPPPPPMRRRRVTFDIPQVAGSSESPLGSGLRAFKRPEAPIEESPNLVKRTRRCNKFLDVTPEKLSDPQPLVRRCFSENITMITSPELKLELAVEPMRQCEVESDEQASIKLAVHRSTTDEDLTGDFSKRCVLPLAVGQHDDLRSISADTLADLINGKYNDQIGGFKIIDCRYPYEFEAGHITGALNLYNKDMIEQHLLDSLGTAAPQIQPESKKRNVIVFHCEFSWERGPNLSRFLRNLDRNRNKDYYPALHYPEMYLLHGGYEQFFKLQKAFCAPQGYRPMRHPDHEADLRQFRSKSKTWQGERSSRISGLTSRPSLKRLGF